MILLCNCNLHKQDHHRVLFCCCCEFNVFLKIRVCLHPPTPTTGHGMVADGWVGRAVVLYVLLLHDKGVLRLWVVLGFPILLCLRLD